jgi:hypothetical protein
VNSIEDVKSAVVSLQGLQMSSLSTLTLALRATTSSSSSSSSSYVVDRDKAFFYPF